MKLNLESNRNKKSVNKDFYQPLNFERSSMVLPVSDISEIVNTYKVFTDERDSCTKYRLNLNLNPIMTNVLSNKASEIKNGNIILTDQNRLNAIQKIDDITYAYKVGYDIFDNNFTRFNTFKTGSTLNDFTGSTLYDLVSIQDAIKNNIIEDNGWVCFANKTKINSNRMFPGRKSCEKIDLFPTRDYFLFKPIYINNNLKDNWDFSLTYPYENYVDNVIVTNKGINGIPIINSSIVIYNGSQYLQITTPYKHGLKVNDIIKIKRPNDVYNSNKTYLVYDTGDLNKNNEEYTFILDANKYSDLLSISNMTNNRLVRVINKIDSNYYIRKFRKLPNFTDETEIITEDNIKSKILTGSTTFFNEMYQPGFSRNIFNDSAYQIQYIDDVDINLIKDNLGRPLTEIFLTIIKKNIIDENNEPSNIFTQVMSGIDELHGVTGYTNVRLINGITQTESPLEVTITTTGGTLYTGGTFYNGIQQKNVFLGDIVEYNRSTVKEIKLDNVYHRFNTVQRESAGVKFQYSTLNQNYTFQTTDIILPQSKEGYIYKPHYSIKLKNYSEIIKQGELPELDICSGFTSGITYTNQIVLLSGQTDNNIKSLILQLSNLTGLTNYDTIRITKELNHDYINVKINIALNLSNCITFPYDKNFMPGVSTLNINNYIIRKYGNSDIPKYSQDQYDGTCLWRDTLREGVFDNDSTKKKECVFTNGRIYDTETFNFYLKRQDPFGYYGLRDKTFPMDLIGKSMTNEDIINKTSKINTIC